MNKVLITGLALGNDIDTCQVCNYDFDWLMTHPSVLAWADKILVSESIWKTIQTEGTPYAEKPTARALKVVFQLAMDAGLIELYKVSDHLPSTVAQQIYNRIDREVAFHAAQDPEHVVLGDDEQVPGQVFVRGFEYCTPNLHTIYSGFYLSRKLGAQCLFGRRTIPWIFQKFSGRLPPEAVRSPLSAFHQVFQLRLPETRILNFYSVQGLSNAEHNCSSCSHTSACDEIYLHDVERRTRKVLDWRDYDEVAAAREAFNRVVEKRDPTGLIASPEELSHEFREEQARLQRHIKKVFPKIRRWANVTSIVSANTALLSASVPDSAGLTLTTAATATLSASLAQAVDLLESRYSWVGYLSQPVEQDDLPWAPAPRLHG